jgi:transcriptional regulator with XRE-family HTH domain
MAKSFRKLIDSLPEERKERIQAKAENLKKEMALAELRQAVRLTQEELASSLNMKQTAISKFEHQSDIYISTLRKILSAMGADLKIIARFPEGEVLINQFNELSEPKDASLHR